MTEGLDRRRISAHAGSRQISFNQEQICLLEAFYPQNRAYNFQATVHVDGALDVGCLEAAVTHVVARHEMLRTTITLGDDGYQANVHPASPCRIPCHDLSALEGAAQAAAVDALFARSVARTFTLAELPLFWLEAVRLAPDRWRLIQVEHHVVHDGWSLGRLWGEIEAAYNALLDGVPPRLPALPAQYQQFVAWQRSRLAGDYGRAALDFWSTYLRGAAEEISLGHGQATGAALDGAGLVLELPAALCDATREAARRLAVSEFVVMFSVFAKLVTSESGQRDLCIGTAVNARTEPELEPLIGMVVNTIPVRVAIDDGDGLAAIARRVQGSLFKAFRFQDVPLSLIVRRLGIAQRRGRNPVYQTCFSFHDTAMPRLRLGAAVGEIRETQNQSSKFDVNVVVIPPSEARGTRGARMFWQFADGKYPGATAGELATAYVELLRALVSGGEGA